MLGVLGVDGGDDSSGNLVEDVAVLQVDAVARLHEPVRRLGEADGEVGDLVGQRSGVVAGVAWLDAQGIAVDLVLPQDLASRQLDLGDELALECLLGGLPDDTELACQLRGFGLIWPVAEKQSEADLCEAFRKWLKARGDCTVHPEVSDFDLVVGCNAQLARLNGFYSGPLNLLPGEGDPDFGIAIGIQAKLHANVEVLYQASTVYGPLLRCVLVPRASYEFLRVAAILNLAVAYQEHSWDRRGKKYWRPVEDGFKVQPAAGHYHQVKPFWLPPVEHPGPAGTPSPRQLTKWRVAAIKLCYLARQQGFLTSADFKLAKVDMRRWIVEQWIVCYAQEGRTKKYSLNADADLPDKGWEEVATSINTLTVKETSS